MQKYIDVKEKGPIVDYLLSLVKNQKIKPCKHLVLKFVRTYFVSHCDISAGSMETADNVETTYDISGYGGGPGHYDWPKCPSNCPVYKKARNFRKHLLLSNVVKEKKFPIQLKLIVQPITPWDFWKLLFFAITTLFIVQYFIPDATLKELIKIAKDYKP